MFKKKALRIISEYKHSHNVGPCRLSVNILLSVIGISFPVLSVVSYIYRRLSLVG